MIHEFICINSDFSVISSISLWPCPARASTQDFRREEKAIILTLKMEGIKDNL